MSVEVTIDNRVLALLAEEPGATTYDVCARIGQLDGAFARLRVRGLVTSIGSDPATGRFRWALTKAGQDATRNPMR